MKRIKLEDLPNLDEHMAEMRRLGISTCIACFQPSTHRVMVIGGLRWRLHFLLQVGVPRAEARAMTRMEPLLAKEMQLDVEDAAVGYIICEDCLGDIPNPYVQPSAPRPPQVTPEQLAELRKEAEARRIARRQERAKRRAQAETQVEPLEEHIVIKRPKHEPSPRCAKCGKRPALEHEALCRLCKSWEEHQLLGR